jgi:flagellar hook-associated protein 1 FlgK
VRAKDEKSGVNLDEEAANLIRYQQAYQASARLMQTANQLFDALLRI